MTWIVLGLVLAVVGWVVITYNRLVARRNRVEEAWSGIDVQLQRRADLVPNLVATVEGYAGHEKEVLREVTEARSRLVAASGPAEAGRADQQLEGALRHLFAVAEGYPDLKASSNFLRLQRDLSTLEEDIAFARRYYNAVVEDHNTGIQRVPNVLIARPLGFAEREYFQAAAADRELPDVDLRR